MNNQKFFTSILADPVTKQPAGSSAFHQINGVLDARVFLKNTHGFNEWQAGQHNYETEMSSSGKLGKEQVSYYLNEIKYDRPVYEYYHLNGAILDVGGGAGTVREFLPEEVQFVSIDPYINSINEIPPARREAYTCLARPLNFMAANAEFLPFVAESFDWVHMRSMIDHVQIPDLAILEAHRVMKPDGRLLIGMYVEGGRSGTISMKQKFKNIVKKVLEFAGFHRWKDHHIWHPTYNSLIKLIENNGFAVEDVYWQPQCKDQVCYICSRKV